MPGPLVVKVRYSTPSAKDSAHAVYIATRPGTDLTVTAASLARMVGRDVSDDATYTRYIAERPGVVADGEAHGLFDEQGIPDLAAVTDELSELSCAPLYRVIVSVNRADAEELGLDSKTQWERHIRASVGDLSAATGIPRENLRWVAAHHDPATGHPHAHIMVWDRTDSPAFKRVLPDRRGGAGHIPAPRLKALRGAFTREMYGVVREEVYEAKDRARSEIRTFGTTTLSLAVEERRRLGEGLVPAGVSGLTRDLDALSRTLPGRGRAAYKYVSPETKAAVDRIVDKLVSTAPFPECITAYADAAVELKRHHTAAPAELAAARAVAMADIRGRLAPDVLQAAVSIQRLRTAESIVRTAPLITRNHLLQGTPEPTRVFYARALMTAGIDRNTAVGVMVKACRGDEPLKDATSRIAMVWAEGQPLRPSEWAAWRGENALPELVTGLQQTQATLHLLEQATRHLAAPSPARVQGITRIDWNRLGRAMRPHGRDGGGRGITRDPRDGLTP